MHVNRDAASFRNRYRLAGLALAVSVPSQAHKRLLDDVLAYKGAQPDAGQDEGVDLRVAFHVGRHLPDRLSLPTVLRHIAEHAESRIDVAFDEGGGVYWLRQEGEGVLRDPAVARVDPASGRADIHLGTSSSVVHERLHIARVFYFTTISLVLLAAERDRYVLHAAALEWDGQGAVFCGPSGQGKTTLTLNLLRAGWDLVTDDSVLLSEVHDEVRVTTFRRELNLTSDAVALLPELGERAWPPPLGLRDKWRVAPEALFGEHVTAQTTPRWLLFPERVAEGPSRLEPLTRVEAFTRLMPQSAMGFVQDTERRVRYAAVLQRLVQKTEPVRLINGPDLYDDPERLHLLVTG